MIKVHGYRSRLARTDSEERIEGELAKGERLLWAGRPAQGVILRAADVFMVPFAFVWLGFVVFWEFSAFISGAPLFFLLWGGLFVLVGTYLALGRFFFDAYRRRATVYGVTSNRIIIVTDFPRESVIALPLRPLSDMSLTERPDRSGDIRFGAGPAVSIVVPGWPGAKGPPTFVRIPEARSVHDLILQAQRDAAEQPSRSARLRASSRTG